MGVVQKHANGVPNEDISVHRASMAKEEKIFRMVPSLWLMDKLRLCQFHQINVNLQDQHVLQIKIKAKYPPLECDVLYLVHSE